MRKTILFLLSLLLISCETDLTSPSSREDIVVAWSPFVGVHPFANHLRIQEPYLDRLIDTNNLEGIRVDGNIAIASNVNILLNYLESRGVEQLGLFPNEYLRDMNVLDIFAQTMAAYPTIDDWEIGNEVRFFEKMEPEEYMPIFKKIFYFAKENYPEKNIIAEAPVGSGGGAQTLGKMIDLGLLDLFDDGLTTVVIHFYSWRSVRLHEFKYQISRLPAHRRIWVTETNYDVSRDMDMTEHVRYVNSVYPKLKNNLGAERIYWYVLAECSNLSLVRGLPEQCKEDPPVESPLFKFLTGALQ